MRTNQIIHLGQAWPDSDGENKYWIGVAFANVQYQGQPPVVGRLCNTLGELESIAQQIREELEKVLAEARTKLAKQPN